MATLPQITPPAPERPAAAPAATGDAAVRQALVPVAIDDIEEEKPEVPVIPGSVARLPIELDVAVPVRNFRVRNLLALDQGQLIETLWHSGEDVPLSAGEVQLAWSEFEVIESDLAVRITRLA